MIGFAPAATNFDSTSRELELREGFANAKSEGEIATLVRDIRRAEAKLRKQGELIPINLRRPFQIELYNIKLAYLFFFGRPARSLNHARSSW